jgi:DNA-binding protein HU-beta
MEKMMNKGELIEKMAQECGLSKHALHNVLECFLETITAALADDGVVKLKGFGTFSAPVRAARETRSLHSGEMIRIPAHKAIKFKAGLKLTKAVQ